MMSRSAGSRGKVVMRDVAALQGLFGIRPERLPGMVPEGLDWKEEASGGVEKGG